MGLIDNWKKRWGIASNWQLILINIVFAITGSMTILVRKPVFELLKLDDASVYIKALVYIITITPSYFIILLIIGHMVGQGKFFRGFVKKTLKRFSK